MNALKNYRTDFFVLFFFAMVLPFFSNGQADDKKKTVALLCHTWKSNFAKNPKKMDCFPADADSTIRFLTNGYIIFNEKKGTEGVWNYDAARGNLYILVYGNLWKYNINALTTTELALAGTDGKKTTVYYLLKSD